MTNKTNKLHDRALGALARIDKCLADLDKAVGPSRAALVRRAAGTMVGELKDFYGPRPGEPGKIMEE
jgi:hypothetical protein